MPLAKKALGVRFITNFFKDRRQTRGKWELVIIFGWRIEERGGFCANIRNGGGVVGGVVGSVDSEVGGKVISSIGDGGFVLLEKGFQYTQCVPNPPSFLSTRSWIGKASIFVRGIILKWRTR